MTRSIQLPPHILAIDPYVPGKPIETLERELGIRDSIKLASNENPLGPSPRAAAAVRAAIDNLHRYPDGAGHEFIAALSAHLGCRPENLIMGNGSDDIIALLTQVLLHPGDRAVMPRPSFLMYEIAVRTVGAEPIFVPLDNLTIDLDGILRAVDAKTRMVFLCNPNNPTGKIIRQADFERFFDALPPAVVVVVDEAYIEFVRDPDCLQTIDFSKAERPLVTLRTFSKLYGLAGLRVGYGIMPAALAEGLNRIRQPFNVNLLAQIGARAGLEDREFVNATLHCVHSGLDYLYGELDRLELTYHPTQANFFLIDMQRDAQAVFEAMLRQGVIVRSMKSYGFPRCIRVNVGTADENRRFIAALGAVIDQIAAEPAADV
ncbi:MAG: histidinol-phosphate transaminase [Desulfobacterales bacterium]|nr:histidinol-phosphate transaminase [Desulfobacterales bacterium]